MDSVCNCKDTDHTVDICIGEIQRLNREAQGFFKLLEARCEYNKNKNGLCHAPLDVYPKTGIIFCSLVKCPIVKEK